MIRRPRTAPTDCFPAVRRRDFLATGLTGLAGISLPGFSWNPLRAETTAAREKHFKIVRIQRTTVKLPFRDVPARNMARELPHWAFAEICEVHLQSGHIGIGETLLYYTWGATSDDDVHAAAGENAAQLMWDDSLGSGLQIALFDAVARTAEVPLHRLLGKQGHQRTPISWWNIDTSAEDMAAECQAAHRQGYTAYKTKGRPWFDVWAQAEAVSQAVPESFKLDMDFNDTLLDAERAIPILQDLQQYPQIGIYESPIFQADIEGNQAIRKATRVPLAMHYGNPAPRIALKEDVCDGFVVGGGARRVLQQGAVAAMADMPFWLQLVGTGITAAYSLHFGAVLSHATWPAVNCHQLYTESLLTKPIQVRDGFSDVPDTPGLGYELDRDAVARLRVDKPQRRPDPPRLIETSWPDGRKMYFGNTGRVNFVLNPARRGEVPYFQRGVTTRLWPNDGSDRWRELYQQARKKPVLLPA